MNLKEMDKKLDEALAKETKESLLEFINGKRRLIKMNLKEEVENRKIALEEFKIKTRAEDLGDYLKQLVNSGVILNYVAENILNFSDLQSGIPIEIAEKYAEEMCKRQKELCAEVYVKQRQMFLESDFDISLNETVFSDVLENAPLATEE